MFSTKRLGMQQLWVWAFCLVCGSASTQALALELEGYRFPAKATVQDQELVVNGASVMYSLSVKVAATALYLEQTHSTVDEALAAEGVKRLHIYAIRTTNAKDLGNMFTNGIRSNATSKEFADNIIGVSQMGSVFSNRAALEKGDELLIDYLPKFKHTAVILNGKQLAQPIQGEKFFPLLLKIWIGPKARDSTRSGLLGIPAP